MKGAATPSRDRSDAPSGASAAARAAAAACAAAARRLLAARARCGAAWAALRLRWSRSLQLRVVGTTLIFSATVIAVLGFFLVQQIAAGLLQNKERSAATLAASGQALATSPTASQSLTAFPGPASSHASDLMADIRHDQRIPGADRRRARLVSGSLPAGSYPSGPDQRHHGRAAGG
jgi:hypothetical protein